MDFTASTDALDVNHVQLQDDAVQSQMITSHQHNDGEFGAAHSPTLTLYSRIILYLNLSGAAERKIGGGEGV